MRRCGPGRQEQAPWLRENGQELHVFTFGSSCRLSKVGQVWSPLLSLQVQNAVDDHRLRGRECTRRLIVGKPRVRADFAEPSDGLEPSNPSLPWNASGKQWHSTATVFACFCGFWACRICDRLPLVATTGLHNGSIHCCQLRLRPRAIPSVRRGLAWNSRGTASAGGVSSRF